MKEWFWSLFGWQRLQLHHRTLWLNLPRGEQIPEWVRAWLGRAVDGGEPDRLIFQKRRY